MALVSYRTYSFKVFFHNLNHFNHRMLQRARHVWSSTPNVRPFRSIALASPLLEARQRDHCQRTQGLQATAVLELRCMARPHQVAAHQCTVHKLPCMMPDQGLLTMAGWLPRTLTKTAQGRLEDLRLGIQLCQTLPLQAETMMTTTLTTQRRRLITILLHLGVEIQGDTRVLLVHHTFLQHRARCTTHRRVTPHITRRQLEHHQAQIRMYWPRRPARHTKPHRRQTMLLHLQALDIPQWLLGVIHHTRRRLLDILLEILSAHRWDFSTLSLEVLVV